MARIYRPRRVPDRAKPGAPPYRPTRRPALLSNERLLRAALNNNEPDTAEDLREVLLSAVGERPPGTAPPAAAPRALPYRPRILFRLADDVKLDDDHHAYDGLPPNEEVAAALAGILSQYPGALAQRALSADPAVLRRFFPEGLRWWAVQLPTGVWPERVLKDLEHKGRSFIATDAVILPVIRAKVERPVLFLEPAPARPPGLEVQFTPADQRFVTAPAGISLGLAAASAWPGSDGAGVRFVDLEQGWALCHDDLPRDGAGQPAIRLIGGANYAFAHHGTAVVGIVDAITGNGAWGDGLASSAEGFVASVWSVKPNWIYDSGAGWGVAHTEAAEDLSEAAGPDAPLVYSCGDALLAALDVTTEGDVLLIEAQVTVDAWHPDDVNARILLPVEACPLTRAIVARCVQLGRIVVESAGNGDVDLDTVYLDGEGFVFGPDQAWRQDSGALMVGAIAPPDPEDDPTAALERARWGMDLGSNHGSRIDVCAWGGEVATIGGQSAEPRGRRTATLNFGGTSAAAAIVAGAAVMLQGARRAAGRPPLTPAEMRAALTLGRVAEGLGTLPDLPAVLTEQVGLPPVGPAPTVDLWLQRFPGDDGETPWSEAPVGPAGHRVAPDESQLQPLPVGGGVVLALSTVVHNRGADAADAVVRAYAAPLDDQDVVNLGLRVQVAQMTALNPAAPPIRIAPGESAQVGLVPDHLWSSGTAFLVVLAVHAERDPAPDAVALARTADVDGDGRADLNAVLTALLADTNNLTALLYPSNLPRG